VDQIVSWISGLDLESNSFKDLVSSFGVFHFVDGSHGVILDGEGGNEKDGTNN